MWRWYASLFATHNHLAALVGRRPAEIRDVARSTAIRAPQKDKLRNVVGRLRGLTGEAHQLRENVEANAAVVLDTFLRRANVVVYEAPARCQAKPPDRREEKAPALCQA